MSSSVVRGLIVQNLKAIFPITYVVATNAKPSDKQRSAMEEFISAISRSLAPTSAYRNVKIPMLASDNRQSASLLGREGFYRADHSIAGTAGIDGINGVVVGGLGRKAVCADAEDGIGVAGVQADVRFCGLGQVFWICTVVHHAEVLVGAARVVARPRDDDRIACSRFQRWPLSNMNAFRLFRGGRRLSGYRGRQKQRVGNRDRQCGEQSVHVLTSKIMLATPIG
jgi:hypothetical protein